MIYDLNGAAITPFLTGVTLVLSDVLGLLYVTVTLMPDATRAVWQWSIATRNSYAIQSRPLHVALTTGDDR